MDWETIKTLLLGYWTRYGTSWVLKVLTCYLGYTADTGKTLTVQIVAGVFALITVICDFMHSRAAKSHEQTVTTAAVVAQLTEPSANPVEKP